MEKFMKSNFPKFIKWIVIVAIIILMVVLINCLHSYQTKQNSIFTTEKWMNGGYEDRHYMIDDLEKNYGVIGKTKEELVKLLGKTSEHEPFSKDGDTIDIYFRYWIEQDSWEGIMVYLIGFKNNRAVTAEIVPEWQL